MPEGPSAGPETWPLWPGAPCPGEGMCAGAGQPSQFLWLGNDGGRGKGLGFSEKFGSSTQGSLSPLRDFPGFSKSGQDTPPFRKNGARNRCPALDGGPGKQEAEAAEGSARPGCGCSQLNPGFAAKKLFTLSRREVFFINWFMKAGDGCGASESGGAGGRLPGRGEARPEAAGRDQEGK